MNADFVIKELNKRTAKSEYRLSYKWQAFGQYNQYIEHHKSEQSVNEAIAHLMDKTDERPNLIFDIEKEKLK